MVSSTSPPLALTLPISKYFCIVYKEQKIVISNGLFFWWVLVSLRNLYLYIEPYLPKNIIFIFINNRFGFFKLLFGQQIFWLLHMRSSKV